MPLFRKKPVTIEARQLTRDLAGKDRIMAWVNTETPPGKPPICCYGDGDSLIIATKEGEMRASPGDWIIKGVAREFYPCKPDIFAATYEEAREETPLERGVRGF